MYGILALIIGFIAGMFVESKTEFLTRLLVTIRGR